MASHGQGESVCLPPPPFHLPAQPCSSILHLVRVAEQPYLSGFQQVFLSRAGGGFYVCTCKSFENMKSSKKKCTPEYVLLEGFCPFPIWIGKYAAWQNVLLSTKINVVPSGLGHVINIYTSDWLFIWATCMKKINFSLKFMLIQNIVEKAVLQRF